MVGQRAKVPRGTKARKTRLAKAKRVSKDVLRVERPETESRFTIAVRPRTFKAFAGKLGPVKPVIEGLGRALEKSRRTGETVEILIEVNPAGMTRVTQDALAALDARVKSKQREPDAALEDALAAARARGEARVADILSGTDMLSADAFADLLGTSRVTVNAKRLNRQLLALDGAKRGYRFPAWQIGRDGKPFSAIPDLFDRLGDAWAVYRFLMQRHPELDGLTGLQALQRGRSKQVVEAAESVAQSYA